MIKSESKDIFDVQKISISNKYLWNNYFEVISQNYEAEAAHLIYQQISILKWFLKNHVTLKTGVKTLNIQLCITGIIYIIKYKYFIKIVKIFHNTSALLYFRSNKFSLGEHRRLLVKILTTPNLWMVVCVCMYMYIHVYILLYDLNYLFVRCFPWKVIVLLEKHSKVLTSQETLK